MGNDLSLSPEGCTKRSWSPGTKMIFFFLPAVLVELSRSSKTLDGREIRIVASHQCHSSEEECANPLW